MDLNPITRARLVSLRRWLLVLTAGALTWTLAISITGGFFARLGSFRISSRNPRTTLFVALASLIGAVVVSRLLGETLRWRELPGRLARASVPADSWIGRHVATRLHVPALRLWRHARSTVPAAMLIAFVIAAAVVDLHQLAGAAPLWLDEEMIALNLRDRSFAELGGRLWLEQSAPYGWLVVQRAVLRALGTGEIALRLVPTLFGIATYVTALWIARRWLTWPAGLALVLLCVCGHSLSHFRVEVKHYTADAFWALLLPALAVWASEAATTEARERRTMIWWAVAAAGLWLANGALLAAPACALFLLAAAMRNGGARAASKQAAWSLVWFASVALHYVIALRHTAYLRNYWAAEFPPADAGWLRTIWWLAARLDRIASDVGGSDAGAIFWALAACGFVWSARPALGMVYGGVALSGFAFAAFRVVPMFDRFSLWMIPALYAGIALLIDRAVRSARDASRQGRRVRGGCALAVACAALVVCVGIFQRGVGRLHMERPVAKQGVDDRSAVTWLMGQWQPGDALMTTPLGLPALWWYGDISIAGDFPAGARPMYEVADREGSTGCALPAALRQHRRLLVYVGFPDMPRGFDELLFDQLDRMGTVTAYREVTTLSRAAVVDLRATGPDDPAFLNREPRGALDGCIGTTAARRR